jgi:hypothetical protein
VEGLVTNGNIIRIESSLLVELVVALLVELLLFLAETLPELPWGAATRRNSICVTSGTVTVYLLLIQNGVFRTGDGTCTGHSFDEYPAHGTIEIRFRTIRLSYSTAPS